MKVKDLIKALEKVNPEMDVYCTSNSGGYAYGEVYTAKPKMITLGDEDGFTGDNDETLVFAIDEQ